jgi:hypothetical protein
MPRTKSTTYHLKPAPAPESMHAHTKVRLCPFPASQRRGGKRYLHPEGETVVANTGEERRWWIAMIRSGDAIQLKEADAKSLPEKRDPYRGPEPIDNGSENVPKLIPAGKAKTPKKGGK